MNEVIRAAADLQALCEAQRWRFCFIGGLALQRWGEPRETVDVDLTLLTGFGGEEPFVRELLKHYEPRIATANWPGGQRWWRTRTTRAAPASKRASSRRSQGSS